MNVIAKDSLLAHRGDLHCHRVFGVGREHVFQKNNKVASVR
jgi:hypothetical protein